MVYGGAAFGPQILDFQAFAHVITAAPGRLKDLLDKGIADLSSLRFLVLDEAYQMLDMGFKDELDAIGCRLTLLFLYPEYDVVMPWDFSGIMKLEVGLGFAIFK